MLFPLRALLVFMLTVPVTSLAQEHHEHPVPERLGAVSFPTSCPPAVQQSFDRAVALLHSFAYRPASDAFHEVARHEPLCAMAYWGIALSQVHQLWESPISPEGLKAAEDALAKARELNSTPRERAFIQATSLLFADAAHVPYRTRALNYEKAMADVVARQDDLEAKTFYALALIGNAPPVDKSHAKLKQAATILEPLYLANPQHPGLAHYLIHACDNAEMAKRGLAAAREYSKIAPSAPHALHMPSHIFTRLGLWEDSIASNLAAKKAAADQGDTGEELHAMDYLVYAYLQAGRERDASSILDQLRVIGSVKGGEFGSVKGGEFKSAYAATAMPIRFVVERDKWSEAANLAVPVKVPPFVTAIAVWARGLGLARTSQAQSAKKELEAVRRLEAQLRASGSDYWAAQTGILALELSAWIAQAEGNSTEAHKLMRRAADTEDGIEKLPVTPGAILPAREQLGDLLTEQKRPDLAAHEYRQVLTDSPGRRRAESRIATREAAKRR